jgi:hypothetical protein
MARTSSGASTGTAAADPGLLREHGKPTPSQPRPRRQAADRGTVTMQARVEAGFARELVEHDAAVLGLDGPSELVREGLRMLHRRAQEMDLATAYDEFYSGRAAPLPAGVVAGDAD